MLLDAVHFYAFRDPDSPGLLAVELDRPAHKRGKRGLKAPLQVAAGMRTIA